MNQRSPFPSRADIGQLLRDFHDGGGGAYDFDNLLYMRFDDPELEEIKKLCARLPDTHPPRHKFEYCNPEGMRIIKEIADRLLSTSD